MKNVKFTKIKIIFLCVHLLYYVSIYMTHAPSILCSENFSTIIFFSNAFRFKLCACVYKSKIMCVRMKGDRKIRRL